MSRMILIALIVASAVVGCAETPPRVVWVEGESYAEGPRNTTEGIGEKLPASGGRALYGAVLGSKGGYARYLVELAGELPDARMLIRYSRHHWREMDPAEIGVTLTSVDQGISRTAVLDKTGGWGTKNKSEWGLAGVRIGTLAAGEWVVQFSAIAERNGDVNIDGFFLVAAGEAVEAAELNAADRIDITGRRYVGVGIPRAIITQEGFNSLELPARGFVPDDYDVTVTLLDADQTNVATLLRQDDVPLNDSTRIVLVDGEPLWDLPDGGYIIRTAWENAPIMDLPIFLVGQLAAGFDQRLAAIVETSQWLAGSEDPAHAALAPDYKHAVEFLTAAWKKVVDGSADKAMLASIRRVLAQYEITTERVKAGQPPYANRTGDLRLAFISAATGRLEEYRLFLPDRYSDEAKIPLMMALNHNVNKYLDQADGVTKRIANARGYAILAPGAVGTDRETAEYAGDGEKDMVQLLKMVLSSYPGLDRTRVYCTGTSRGGFGTYSFATNHPEFFAAIACSSGTGNWKRGDGPRGALDERFAPVPTLILHGEIDNLVPQEVAKQVAAKLAEVGVDHELHIFPSYGHSYENYAAQYLTMTLDWFDKYSKPDAAEIDLRVPAPEPKPAAPVPAPAPPTTAPAEPVTPDDVPGEPAPKATTRPASPHFSPNLRG